MRLGNNHLRLTSIKKFSTPFDYFTSPEAFSPELSRDALDWLEANACWNLVRADFYEQYEFSLCDVRLPPELAILTEENFISGLKKRLEDIFCTRLGARVEIVAHKLIPGQRIRLHNDFIAGEESHRFLVQFNRGWTDDDGGLLLIFSSADPSDLHTIFRPVHNTAVAFGISSKSFHAVSLVRNKQRFTLVYSFFQT
jgi:Rps23 Pro-64 3,4-dihydroxylase Tpa1-like proline 4-hydroxylase